MSPFDAPGRQAGQPPRGLMVACAFLAALLLATVALLLAGPDGGPAAAPAPSKSSKDSTSASSACGLPDGALVLGQPPVAEWQPTGHLDVPVTSAGGPGRAMRGVRSCFARSAEGALLAAVNVVATGAMPSTREEGARQLMVPGPGRDAALRTAVLQRGVPDDPTTEMQVAGYRLDGIEDDRARVSLALRIRSGGALAFLTGPLDLRWLDGDWRLQPPVDGEVFAAFAVQPNLGDFVPWSPA